MLALFVDSTKCNLLKFFPNMNHEEFNCLDRFRGRHLFIHCDAYKKFGEIPPFFVIRMNEKKNVLKYFNISHPN